MTGKSVTFRHPTFAADTVVIVGGYGSGKSEVSVNLARYLASEAGRPVSLADLDIMNPYFRSREAAAELSRLGIRPLIPPGELVHSELPILVPEIKSAIQDGSNWLILDIGGDDQGARVLSALSDAFIEGRYELLLVLNANRPFTADVASTRKLMREIETSSRLKFTGIISNTHLMDDTTVETVMDGLKLAGEVSRATGLPVAFFSATRNIVNELGPDAAAIPLLPLDRSLLKPWEKRRAGDNAQ